MDTEASISALFTKIGKKIVQYSVLGKGEASVVYKITTDNGLYTLKTALYPQRKDKVLQEATIRNYFLNKGLDFLPAPVYTDNTLFPNGAVIYEFIDGKVPDFTNLDSLKQMAHILARIHSTNFKVLLGPTTITNLEATLTRITSKTNLTYSNLVNSSIKFAFEKALTECKALFSKFIANHPNMKSITADLHGDLSNNFIIDSHDKIWLIDWENSEYGDITEEVCWFLFTNDFTVDMRESFIREYKSQFQTSQPIDFDQLYPLYASVNSILNICFGIDQLQMNIQQSLEPERKLHDLAITAQGWTAYFSQATASVIIQGISQLRSYVQTILAEK